MKKTVTFCYASNQGEFLNDGECFETALLNEFEWASKTKWRKQYEWLHLLIKYFDARKGKNQDEVILSRLFSDKMLLDYNFAKTLNLFDVLTAECFTGIGELGRAMRRFCINSELQFIVTRKTYRGIRFLEIELEVCSEDYLRDCLKALITQSIND